MSATKIQVGYGSDQRKGGNPKRYANRNQGKVVTNGGFNNGIVEDFHNIPQEEWDRMFPNGFRPSWMNNA